VPVTPAHPLGEARDLRAKDRMRRGQLGPAETERAVHEQTQIVERVDLDARQVRDLRIDVARHGEVDQHERRGAAAPDVMRAEDRARGARRADHEVCPRERVVKTIRRDRVAAALRGEALRAGGVAAEHEQLAHAVP
jgi:hypothetical protein